MGTVVEEVLPRFGEEAEQNQQQDSEEWTMSEQVKQRFSVFN